MDTATMPRADREPIQEVLGAAVVDGRTTFRLLTDQARRCQVRVLNDDASPRAIRDMKPEGDGHHCVVVDDAPARTLYDFVLDGAVYPEPYARFLPRGVPGPAQVMDSSYRWVHGGGVARPLREQVIYEIHVGTFTPEGTYEAARARLPYPMVVDARDGVLVVRRSAGGRTRVLVANLSDQPVSLAALAPDMADRRLLLRSDLAADLAQGLPGWTAAVLGDSPTV